MADNGNNFSINIGINLDNEGKQLLDQWTTLKDKIESDKLNINFGDSLNNSLKDIGNISTQIEKLSQQISGLNSNGRNVEIFNTKNITSQIDQLSKSAKSIEDIKRELSSLDNVKTVTINSSQIDKDNNSLIKFIATVTKTTGEIEKLQYVAKDFIPSDKGLEPLTYQFENLTKLIDNTDKVSQKLAEQEEKNSQKIQDAIGKTIEKREEENKTLQQNQDSAINKALDKEYEDRQKIQEAINATIKAREKENEVLEQNQANAINKNMDQEYNQVQKFVEKSTVQLEKLQEKFKNVINENDVNALKNKLNGLNINNFKDDSGNITSQLNQYKNQLAEQQRVSSLGSNIGSLSSSGLNMGSSIQDINKYVQETMGAKASVSSLTESEDKFGNAVKTANVSVNEGSNIVSKYKVALDETSGSIYKMSTGTQNLSSKHGNLGEQLISSATGMAKWMASATLLFGSIEQIKKGFEDVIQMDSTLNLGAIVA